MRQNDDDWLGRWLDTLRPGWRGRLELVAAEEEAPEGGREEIVGTVVEEPAIERDADDAAIDATITLCANYRGGRFVPVHDEPRIVIRASQIRAAEPM
jgi:hypothetical protein